MDEEHALALLGLATNVIVYEDGAGGRDSGRKAPFEAESGSWFLSMFYLHRFEKRTV
jgi:hypothetical protein